MVKETVQIMDLKACAAETLLKGKTVLIVERDYFLHDDARAMITNMGAFIVTAPSFRAAMAAMDSNVPDAAILDIELEAHDSFALAERLDEERVPYVFACCEAFAQESPTFGGFVLRGSVPALNDLALALFARSGSALN